MTDTKAKRTAQVWLASLVVAVLLAGLLLAVGCAGDDADTRTTLSIRDTLGETTQSFDRALAPREFHFPLDHAAHDSYRNEWWYFTGNLEDVNGQRFGYQLTFFRTALSSNPSQRSSAWATNQVYMAHLAVTDVERGRFVSFQQFARGAAGLAGTEHSPFRVWMNDWAAASTSKGPSTDAGPEGIFPLRLSAHDGKTGIDLTLQADKGIVLQGERGLSRKGEDAGNASYYYSFTRLPTRGTISTEAGSFECEGHSWLDREWSTSALSRDQVGWDWFALQLSDGSELMYYRLRTSDGLADMYSAGTIVDKDGSYRTLRADDVSLTSTGTWQSALDKAVYPARWNLKVPSAGLDLEIVPVLANQELDLAIRYWEGAVDIKGTRLDSPISGQGYVELTGYAERAK